MSIILRNSVYNIMDETSKWYNMRPPHSANVRDYYKQVKECLIVVVCGNPDVSHKFRV